VVFASGVTSMRLMAHSPAGIAGPQLEKPPKRATVSGCELGHRTVRCQFRVPP
jgi:hypothetical protein